MPPLPTDEVVLRTAIRQVLKANITRYSGWREGSSWQHPDAGKQLIDRGVLLSGINQRMTLSEAALIRALRVGIDAAVADLLANDPPEERIPWKGPGTLQGADDDEVASLIIEYDNTVGIRGW